MSTLVVTALFDIGREERDSRSMPMYLDWLEKTLKLKCDFSIYTQYEYKEFCLAARDEVHGIFNTYVNTHELNQCPFYKNLKKIAMSISSEGYKQKMSDCRRIECRLPEYLMIQYSKFGWLVDSIRKHPNYDYYFWMDAGFSRFFNNWDINKQWPKDENEYDKRKITNIGNIRYEKGHRRINPEKHMWSTKCVRSGGMFGGTKSSMIWLKKQIDKTFEDCMVNHGCVNNEQILIDIIATKNPGRFAVKFPKKSGNWLGLL